MAEELPALTSRSGLSLAGVWLVTALLSIVAPIIVPSYPGTVLNPISVAMMTMFLLSLPGSLFAFPVAYIADLIVGVDPNAIGGKYIYILTLFATGLVQWFWVAPRLWRARYVVEKAEVLDQNQRFLNDTAVPENEAFFDASRKTPLERVIEDDKPR